MGGDPLGVHCGVSTVEAQPGNPTVGVQHRAEGSCHKSSSNSQRLQAWVDIQLHHTSAALVAEWISAESKHPLTPDSLRHGRIPLPMWLPYRDSGLIFNTWICLSRNGFNIFKVEYSGWDQN